MATILIVEDERDLNHLIRTELEAEGHRILQAFDGLIAVQMVEEHAFDLIILDWMLPGLDGLAVCRRIRQTHLVPIVMLTARTELVDRVLGLEVGADDYIAKPFSMHELRARIAAILRRVDFERQMRDTLSEQAAESNSVPTASLPALVSTPPLIYGPLVINRDEYTATLNGLVVDLTRKEYELLLFLVSYPGRTFSRDFLLERLWGDDYEGLDRAVDTHITRLRKKLGGFGAHIDTVWGIGYRFVV